MKKFFDTSNDLGMFLLRVGAGLVMLPYGLTKIGVIGEATMSQTVSSLGGMGVPSVIAYLVILAETVGAVSLVLGFCTRFCAASLGVIMFGAVYLMFGAGFFAGYATPLVFLVAYLPLIVNGGGSYSVDQSIAAKMK
jgi:putative oxidoreductase